MMTDTVKLGQGDNLDSDRYVVLILSKDDISNHTKSRKDTDKLFNSERFRDSFEDYLIQDWNWCLKTVIESFEESTTY